MPRWISVNTSTTSPQLLHMAERRVEVMDRRLRGESYHEIALALGVSPSTAFRDVEAIFAELGALAEERAAELRELILVRSDAMLEVLLPKAMEGQLGVVDRVLAIHNQMLEVLGGKISRVDLSFETEPKSPTVFLPAVADDSRPE